MHMQARYGVGPGSLTVPARIAEKRGSHKTIRSRYVKAVHRAHADLLTLTVALGHP